ncbi:sigma-54-dependent Fis family transcriptional regulator [Undibacterium sp. WLX3042]|uniref:sigma-54-dependent Fis family transcriptional regulator n=1 Tax=Undibacterium sp. WLX3042 TaxID=3412686 RepID=UPI003C30D1A4
MRNHAILPSSHLKQARLQLVEYGISPSPGINDRIAQSWQRSLSAGLSPVGRVECEDNLSSSNLQHARHFNHELISHSEPVIEYLFEQVRHSHSMVILADAQGVLMHTLGDLDFLDKADRVALKCGATWAESQRGTNAIGTAVAEANEIEIHGAEHYLEHHEFLTCAAAPILSAQGKLMGILDISGDHRSRHPHTLGLVSTAAQIIENSMVLSASQHQIIVQLHPRAEGLGSVAQGVLVFSEDGWLTGANRKGLALMKLQYSDIAATCWSDLFDKEFQHILSFQQRTVMRPDVLRTRDGSVLFAQVHSHSLARQALSVQTKSAPATLTSATANEDSLWLAASERARKVIDKAIPLLVTGESGVGKELFAQATHRASLRRNKPFVAVNCAAIPEHLIEAELFGYVAGAFTGASKQGAQGRLREAHGGTLFLDEIGDMPLSLQTRLLRVLQERQVTPLGSSTPVNVDFNLICATHQNLKNSIVAGRFREDLYYRINGLTVCLPALRMRTDFAFLCGRLLQEFAPDSDLHIEPDLLAAMKTYHWPGNLRQLSHVLRAAVALREDDQHCISWEHLADDLAAELRSQTGTETITTSAGGDTVEPRERSLHARSMQAIRQALTNANGNVSAAARELGISRQTLYRKLQEN